MQISILALFSKADGPWSLLQDSTLFSSHRHVIPQANMVKFEENIAAGAVLPAVDIVLVALRFYAKRKTTLKYGVDDWLILVSLVRSTGKV